MNVIITGASRGIGLGFVNHYLAAGDHVWAGYRRDMGGLRALNNPRLRTVKWDVGAEQDAASVATAGFPERVELLINNAGIYGPEGVGQALDTVSSRTMHEVFDVNCVGALRTVQQLWRRMTGTGGVIANISSKMGSSADNSSGGCYAYRAAKAALVICSKSMAIDLAPHGIYVITLHPGWVRTDMTDHHGLIDVDESVRGMTDIIRRTADYEAGAFVAFDGRNVPY